MTHLRVLTFVAACIIAINGQTEDELELLYDCFGYEDRDKTDISLALGKDCAKEGKPCQMPAEVCVEDGAFALKCYPLKTWKVVVGQNNISVPESCHKTFNYKPPVTTTLETPPATTTTTTTLTTITLTTTTQTTATVSPTATTTIPSTTTSTVPIIEEEEFNTTATGAGTIGTEIKETTATPEVELMTEQPASIPASSAKTPGTCYVNGRRQMMRQIGLSDKGTKAEMPDIGYYTAFGCARRCCEESGCQAVIYHGHSGECYLHTQTVCGYSKEQLAQLATDAPKDAFYIGPKCE